LQQLRPFESYCQFDSGLALQRIGAIEIEAMMPVWWKRKMSAIKI
jgi:hypothetical protein